MSPGPRALVVSLVAHAALLGGWISARLPIVTPRAEASATAIAARDAAIVEASRRALIARARAEIAAGKFSLGEFLLDASEIDAAEAGRDVDMSRARRAYAARVKALATALRTEDLPAAVRRAFGDLRYFGRPGGLVAEALVDRGGSCEPIAELVVAAAYDAGRGDEVALRYFGGGATAHLAPTAITDDGDEIDLATGELAIATAARIEPEELVDVYARAHGLSPPLDGAPPGSSARPDRAVDDALPSLSAGFPANDAAFPGAAPLFAAQAITEAPRDAEATPRQVDGRIALIGCAHEVGLGALDPTTVRLDGGGDVELRAVPSPLSLERRADQLRRAEDFGARDDADDADRLMSDACIGALGDELAADLALAGDSAIARTAAERAHTARARGAALLAKAAATPTARAELRARLAERFLASAWLVVTLRGGGDVLLEMARDPGEDDDWGTVVGLAALVVSPATRERGLAIAGALDARAQVDVMHELTFAKQGRGQLRYVVDLDRDRPRDEAASPPGPGEAFQRAYRAFKRLAQTTIDARATPADALDAFDRDADREHVDLALRTAMLEYYARNVLDQAAADHEVATALALRGEPGEIDDDSLDLARDLDRALTRRRDPATALTRLRVHAAIESGHIDDQTIADAWRLRR